MIGLSGGELDQARAEQLIVAADPARLVADPRALSILESIVQATSDPASATLADNGSGATIRGLAAREVSFAYAYRPARRLALGARLALIDGLTFRRHYGLDDLLDGDGLLDAIDRHGETLSSVAPSIDAGLQWRFGRPRDPRAAGAPAQPSRVRRRRRRGADRPPRALPAGDLGTSERDGSPSAGTSTSPRRGRPTCPTLPMRQANVALAFRPARPLDLWIGAADNLAQPTGGAQLGRWSRSPGRALDVVAGRLPGRHPLPDRIGRLRRRGTGSTAPRFGGTRAQVVRDPADRVRRVLSSGRFRGKSRHSKSWRRKRQCSRTSRSSPSRAT